MPSWIPSYHGWTTVSQCSIVLLLCVCRSVSACVYLCLCDRLEVLVKMENRGVELVKQVDMSMTIPDTGTVHLQSVTNFRDSS